MQGLAAMVTTADADTFQVKHGRDVIRMNAIHKKGGQGSSIGLLLWGGPKDSNTLDGL